MPFFTEIRLRVTGYLVGMLFKRDGHQKDDVLFEMTTGPAASPIWKASSTPPRPAW